MKYFAYILSLIALAQLTISCGKSEDQSSSLNHVITKEARAKLILKDSFKLKYRNYSGKPVKKETVREWIRKFVKTYQPAPNSSFYSKFKTFNVKDDNKQKYDIAITSIELRSEDVGIFYYDRICHIKISVDIISKPLGIITSSNPAFVGSHGSGINNQYCNSKTVPHMLNLALEKIYRRIPSK